MKMIELGAARLETRAIVDARVLEPDPRHCVPRRDRPFHEDPYKSQLMPLDRPTNLFPVDGHAVRAVRVGERSVKFLMPHQRCCVSQDHHRNSPQWRARAEARVAAHHECYDRISRDERPLERELVLGRCRHRAGSRTASVVSVERARRRWILAAKA